VRSVQIFVLFLSKSGAELDTGRPLVALWWTSWGDTGVLNNFASVPTKVVWADSLLLSPVVVV
jgi:hypothetical protein